jgi:uncharacterized protein
MKQNYLTVARQGKNRLTDYIVGAILISVVTIIVATFALLILALFARYPTSISIFKAGGVERFIYEDRFRYLIFIGSAFAAIILGLFLAITRVHNRRFLTLISPDESISLHRAIEGFIVGLGVWMISFPIWYFINPARYTFVFNPSEWLPLALFSLALLPIISFAGSLLLAYLMQGLGLVVRKPLFLLIAIACISCLGAKTIDGLIIKMLSSTFIVWIVLKDNRLELATGLIASGQLISMIFIGNPNLGLKLPTIIKIPNTSVPLISLASLLLTNSLFYYICFVISKNRPKSSYS